MTAQVYRRPEADGFATLVIDFTPMPVEVAPAMASTMRATSSSRGSGRNVGVIYYERSERIRCADCGGVTHGRTPPGKHAPVGSPEGMRNCVGKLIEVWP